MLRFLDVAVTTIWMTTMVVVAISITVADAYAAVRSSSSPNNNNQQLRSSPPLFTSKILSQCHRPSFRLRSSALEEQAPAPRIFDDDEKETVESHTTVLMDDETNLPLQQQMIYVDEYNCIGCTACALIAEQTFFMESGNGRARVFQQWGDSEDTIQEAIETCPVDCIHYVPYQELVDLEVERRDQVINFKERLVGGAGTGGGGQQNISGNKKMRCPSCPTNACLDCPMFLMATTQPKFDVIGAVSAPKQRKIERSMNTLVQNTLKKDSTARDLSTAELAAKVFDDIDKDGDGTLQKSELIAAGVKMGALSILDLDKDGSVSRDEFMAEMDLAVKSGLSLDLVTGAKEKHQPMDQHNNDAEQTMDTDTSIAIEEPHNDVRKMPEQADMTAVSAPSVDESSKTSVLPTSPSSMQRENKEKSSGDNDDQKSHNKGSSSKTTAKTKTSLQNSDVSEMVCTTVSIDIEKSHKDSPSHKKRSWRPWKKSPAQVDMTVVSSSSDDESSKTVATSSISKQRKDLGKSSDSNSKASSSDTTTTAKSPSSSSRSNELDANDMLASPDLEFRNGKEKPNGTSEPKRHNKGRSIGLTKLKKSWRPSAWRVLPSTRATLKKGREKISAKKNAVLELVTDKKNAAMELAKTAKQTTDEKTAGSNSTGDKKKAAVELAKAAKKKADKKTEALKIATEAKQEAFGTANQIGEELEDAIGALQPLERQELRLAGFEPYIVISVLTSESSYETIKEYNTDWSNLNDIDMDTLTQMIQDQQYFQEMVNKVTNLSGIDWFLVGIQLSSALSAVCGIYATVVFCLCILYGKTALGLERDEEYYIFMENTGLQRFRALNAFSYGLFFWAFSLVLVFCDHAPFVLKPPLFIGSMLLLMLAKVEYDILTAAAAPMFRPRKPNSRQ